MHYQTSAHVKIDQFYTCSRNNKLGKNYWNEIPQNCLQMCIKTKKMHSAQFWFPLWSQIYLNLHFLVLNYFASAYFYSRKIFPPSFNDIWKQNYFGLALCELDFSFCCGTISKKQLEMWSLVESSSGLCSFFRNYSSKKIWFTHSKLNRILYKHQCSCQFSLELY